MTFQDSLFLILFIIVEGVLIFTAISNFRMYSKITKTPTTPISKLESLGNGFREIKGEVVPLGQEFLSPLVEKQCVYYELKVEREDRSEKGSYWKKINEEKNQSKFGIDDGTGIAEIDIALAKVNIEHKITSQSFTDDSPALKEKSLLRKFFTNE